MSTEILPRVTIIPSSEEGVYLWRVAVYTHRRHLPEVWMCGTRRGAKRLAARKLKKAKREQAHLEQAGEVLT